MERPKINLQQFARGSSSLTPIPRVGDNQVSLRSLPGVRDVGTESQVDAYMSMANDANRLQMLSGQQFDRELNEVKAAQKLEQEARYADFALELQEAIEKARLDAPTVEDIGEFSKQAYQQTYEKHFGKGSGQSEFQRNYIQPKLENTELRVGQSTFEYQMRLRQVEAERQAEAILNADLMMVQDNPAMLDEILEDSRRKISETLGATTDAVTENLAYDNHKKNLVKAQLSGILTQPGGHVAVLDKLKQDFYRDNLDANTYAAIKQDAKRVQQNILAEQQKAQASLNSRVVDVFFSDIERGQVPSNGVEELGLNPGEVPSYQQINDLYLSGSITKTQRNAGLKAIDAYYDAGENNAQAFQMLNSEAIILGDDRKNAEKALTSARQELPQQEWVALNIGTFKRHGIVSNDFVQMVEIATGSNNIEQVQEAIQIMDNLQAIAPGRAFPWSDTTTAKLVKLKQDLNANLTSSDADPEAFNKYRMMSLQNPQLQGLTKERVREAFKVKDKPYKELVTKAMPSEKFIFDSEVENLIEGGQGVAALRELESTFFDRVATVAQSSGMAIEDAMDVVIQQDSKKLGLDPFTNELTLYPIVPPSGYDEFDIINSAKIDAETFFNNIEVDDSLGLIGALKDAKDTDNLDFELVRTARTAETWQNSSGIETEYELVAYNKEAPSQRIVINKRFRPFEATKMSRLEQERINKERDIKDSMQVLRQHFAPSNREMINLTSREYNALVRLAKEGNLKPLYEAHGFNGVRDKIRGYSDDELDEFLSFVGQAMETRGGE